MNRFPFFRRHHDANDEPEAIEGERAATPVNKPLNMQARITNWVIIGAIILVVFFALGKYYVALFSEQAEKAAQKKDNKHTMATNLPPLTVPDFPDAAASAPPSSGAPPPPLLQQQTTGNTNAAPHEKPPPTEAELRLARQLGAPVFFKIDKAGGTTNAVKDGMPDEEGQLSLTGTAQASGYSAAKAFMLPDPSLMVTIGTGIPCVVRPMLNTTLPGMVTCIQSADVRSADKTAVLIERGTKWVGMQATGLAQGMKRVGIIWLRGETPNHVLIPIDAESGDALGQPGIEGDVNTHFWRRIGEAVAVSLITDVGSYFAATKQSSGSNNTTIAFPGTVNGVQSAMSDILKTTLNIPDTMTRNQGAEVTIFVQKKDIDFRDVYQFQLTNNANRSKQ